MLRSKYASILSLALLSSYAACTPQVEIDGTTISGATLTDLNQEFFGGIPYAESPVGHLRFAPPVLKTSPGVAEFNASSYGPSCFQLPNNILNSIPAALNSSDDCLSINVFRPAESTNTSALPVMMWVYGGGFALGESRLYNAGLLVAESVSRQTPIIYVSFNYRTGPFGFPQGQEATAGGSLNLGNKDALTALEWVQRNIGVFGGDKDKITLFGESAGAILISQLLLDPNFHLARAAILESGSVATNRLYNGTTREADWQNFVSAVPECAGAAPGNTFDCLRSADYSTVYNASVFAYNVSSEAFPFAPVIDGPGGIIPDLPSRLYAKGEFAKIPIISGTNLDEGTVFTSTSINSTQEIYLTLVAQLSPPDSSIMQSDVVNAVDELLVLYPDDPSQGSPFGTGNQTFGLSSQFKRAAAISGDLVFTSLRRELSQVMSNAGVKVFSYLFVDPQAYLPLLTGNPQPNPPYWGVAHGEEVQYVYGASPNGPASVTLAQTMIDYWVSFANGLDPNDKRGNTTRPIWSQYTSNRQNVIQLHSTNLTMIPDTFRRDQIGYILNNPVPLRH